MEALVTAFVAAFLAEWGDKSQLVAAALVATTKRPAQILAGLLLAVLASNTIAAVAGDYVAATVTIRAMTLMTALALLFAAVSGLIPRKAKPLAPARLPVLTAFILILAAETGDRTQFLTFALAGRFDNAPLAAAGATAGILAACVPALMLGDKLTTTVPVRGIRWTTAGAFLVAAFVTGVIALRLA